jgi:KDO2-lipid IV(A) lauroyltransferase
MRRLLETIVYVAPSSGLKVGCLAVRFLPRRWIFALSDSLASLGYYLFRGFRTRSISNLKLALADRLDSNAVKTTVRRSLRNFSRACVEIAIALESSDEDLRREIGVSGKEHLEAASAKGKGIIVLSAHLGNFILLGTRLAVEGYSIHVVVNQPRTGTFAKLMDEYRWRIKQHTIHAKPRHQALHELHRVLRRGEVAVMIADEYRTGDGVHVPLFGRKVLARRGPATLASRTGAAIVPACMVRQPDDSLKLVIEQELEIVRPGKAKAEIRENTSRMTQWLERTVRNHPDQWNWMNIRWSEAPVEDMEHGAGSMEPEGQRSEVRSQRSEL